MLITLVRCWMLCLLLLGEGDVDEVRMMAMSPWSRMVAAADDDEDEWPPPDNEDACSSDDVVALLFVGLKFKISSSPDKRVSDSESLGLVF